MPQVTIHVVRVFDCHKVTGEAYCEAFLSLVQATAWGRQKVIETQQTADYDEIPALFDFDIQETRLNQI